MPPHAGRVDEVARRALERGMTVAVVESLTSGALASTLGAGQSASEWFRGGVVAYQVATKEHVLGVAPGTDPSSDSCAEQLARGGRALMDADLCVSVTGVGGPDPEGLHPAGEVHLGWATRHEVGSEQQRFAGDPVEVIRQSVARAVAIIRDRLDAA